MAAVVVHSIYTWWLEDFSQLLGSCPWFRWLVELHAVLHALPMEVLSAAMGQLLVVNVQVLQGNVGPELATWAWALVCGQGMLLQQCGQA
jgi:hypothetical protein